MPDKSSYAKRECLLRGRWVWVLASTPVIHLGFESNHARSRRGPDDYQPVVIG